jgi:DNA-binding transcriptional LysR family regulator
VIAGNEATCIYVLPRVFAEFKKRFPNVQLLVDRSYGTRVVQAVMDNQADFGLTQLPVEEKKLEAVKIHSDEIRLLVPYHHRLAQYAQVLPQDLLGEPLLIPKTGTTRAKLNEWLDPIDHEMTISMELDSTEMIKRFVMAEIGISFLAASHCAEEVEAKRLAAVSLGPEPMMRRLGLIYRKDKALSKAALGFIQVTLENAGTAGIASGINQRFPKAAGS